MSLVADLAALIAERRAAYDRALESDLARFRVIHGDQAVREALRAAEAADLHDNVSIVESRRRKQRHRAAQREAQLLFRTKR